MLLQSSKEDSNCYLTAQDNDQNDKRIRRNQHFVTICDRRELINNKLKKIYTEDRILAPQQQERLYILCNTYKYQLNGIERGLKHISKFPLYAKPIFNLYNTHQKIKNG